MIVDTSYIRMGAFREYSSKSVDYDTARLYVDMEKEWGSSLNQRFLEEQSLSHEARFVLAVDKGELSQDAFQLSEEGQKMLSMGEEKIQALAERSDADIYKELTMAGLKKLFQNSQDTIDDSEQNTLNQKEYEFLVARAETADGGMMSGRFSHEETDLTLDSSGVIFTQDGTQINLDLRETFHNENTFEGFRYEPLVINFGTNKATASSDWTEFDITGDGIKEAFHFMNSGSGLLAFDANGNGKVDDGTELFGPTHSNSFQAMSAFDTNGNGWIDVADEGYNQLSVWHQNDAGEKTLSSLSELGVGALYTNAVDAFHYDDSSSNMGSMLGAGFFLKEDGTASTLQSYMFEIKNPSEILSDVWTGRYRDAPALGQGHASSILNSFYSTNSEQQNYFDTRDWNSLAFDLQEKLIGTNSSVQDLTKEYGALHNPRLMGLGVYMPWNFSEKSMLGTKDTIEGFLDYQYQGSELEKDCPQNIKYSAQPKIPTLSSKVPIVSGAESFAVIDTVSETVSGAEIVAFVKDLESDRTIASRAESLGIREALRSNQTIVSGAESLGVREVLRSNQTQAEIPVPIAPINIASEDEGVEIEAKVSVEETEIKVPVKEIEVEVSVEETEIKVPVKEIEVEVSVEETEAKKEKSQQTLILPKTASEKAESKENSNGVTRVVGEGNSAQVVREEDALPKTSQEELLGTLLNELLAEDKGANAETLQREAQAFFQSKENATKTKSDSSFESAQKEIEKLSARIQANAELNIKQSKAKALSLQATRAYEKSTANLIQKTFDALDSSIKPVKQKTLGLKLEDEDKKESIIKAEAGKIMDELFSIGQQKEKSDKNPYLSIAAQN